MMKLQYISLLLALTLTTLPLQAQDADTEGPALAELLKTRSASIVTIRAVLKLEFGGNAEEMRREIQGVVVDESGLIMTVNGALSPPGNERFKITPSDLQVVIGNEEKEYSARFVAKDTKLDLAFLQMKDLGDRKLTAIDFGASKKPVIGQRIVTVSRLAKGFDYAPVYLSTRVNGRVKKPRKCWTTELVGDAGLPVFALDGTLVGVNTTLDSGMAESAGNPFMRMLSGGGNTSISVVLPAKIVKGLIDQARKRAATMEDDETKTEEKPAEAPEKKTDDAKKEDKKNG